MENVGALTSSQRSLPDSPWKVVSILFTEGGIGSEGVGKAVGIDVERLACADVAIILSVPGIIVTVITSTSIAYR